MGSIFVLQRQNAAVRKKRAAAFWYLSSVKQFASQIAPSYRSPPGAYSSTTRDVYAHPSELETELSVSFSFALFSSVTTFPVCTTVLCLTGDKSSPFTIWQGGVFRPQTEAQANNKTIKFIKPHVDFITNSTINFITIKPIMSKN